MTNSLSFFLPDVIGGASTVIRNHLLYAGTQQFEFFVIKTCNTTQTRTNINFTFPNATSQEFNYSHLENSTKVYTRLYKSLPASDSIIIATDALELGMAHYLKLPNKVIFVVLGDFQHYYNLAVTHQDSIDLYVGISEEITRKLKNLLPHKTSCIKKSYFPVPASLHTNQISESSLRVIFVGRFDEVKGVMLIPKIDSYLKDNHVRINWTLVGDGSLKPQILNEIVDTDNFTFMGFLAYNKLLKEYKNHDIYLLPSKSEGLPISLIEAMKSGLVPLVSDISGGIREIVSDNFNGFRIKPITSEKFALALYNLDKNRDILKKLRKQALDDSRERFNPNRNASAFFQLVSKVSSDPTPKSINVDFVPQNRLDRPYIPNGLVKTIRKLRSILL